ncbi:pyruvate kinase [Candidatus Mycoplasma haematohominis]|uniref:pyruvate kinase n=1 Tax=Candidatus Mycoplasma haematohominis TaxID=1494318 RepID=UPI001C0A6AE3|nr:pyruvate kinase [Candidatus Mycoplasma haemohominis]
MKYLLKNTKIVSTFGPSITFDLDLTTGTAPEELKNKVQCVVKDVISAGVNCVRYNFSHGQVAENTTRTMAIFNVQKEFISKQEGSSRRYLRSVVLLADTKGPEIRVFDMGKDGVSYNRDQEIIVSCIEQKTGSSEGFSVFDATGTYNMANDCVVGNLILVEDGKLTLEILEVDKERGFVKAKVKNTYLLKRNKRINLPGADYSMNFLSDKDTNDIKYAIDNGFEFVALSFANSRDDVMQVRNLIESYCKEKQIPNIMKVYSKIETLKACKNLDEIIDSSDGIMIARGDLGLEIPYYEVPYWTQQIIKKCRKLQKPAITATQMLDSLERNVVATRAEVSDVYRAAEMGSDCTMLSGETAQGQFPVLAVETMTNIVYESEKYFNSAKFEKLFYDEIFDSLDSGVKSQFEDFKKALSSVGGIQAIAMKGKSFSIKFLKALSALRMKINVFVFQIVENIEVCCGDPDWKNEDYLNAKVLSDLALYRGIDLVFVDGKTDSKSSCDMLKEYLSFYGKDCKYQSDVKTVLYFDEDEGKWRLSN